MRKIRRFLQALLFINFIVGLRDGMRAGNLAVVVINGVAVLVLILVERKGKEK